MSDVGDEIRLYAGTRARTWITRDGLQPQQLSAVAAAAGGPKGLGLIALDRWLFGEWLADHTAALDLVGASIGAWRMAAAAQRDPVAALTRLADTYIGPADLSSKPSRDELSGYMRRLGTACLPEQGAWPQWTAGRRLHVLTNQAGPALGARNDRLAFARAAAANARGRKHLASFLQRVIFTGGDVSNLGPQPLGHLRVPADAMGRLLLPAEAMSHLPIPADGLGHATCPLTPANLSDALQASGNLPLLCHPVTGIADAPPGCYWDGGLIDYHLAWPWTQYAGLVLYPHFRPGLIPGWLDKAMPWREWRVGQGNPALDNVLLVTPGPALLERLPGGKLPERQDFHRCKGDLQGLARRWRTAYQECERLAEAFARWVESPDPRVLRAL